MLALGPFREGGTALKGNRQPSTIDIDLDHAGLFCRADVACRKVFHPRSQDSQADLATSVAARDFHEARVHAYRHVVIKPTPFSFADYHAQKRRTAMASGSDRINFG